MTIKLENNMEENNTVTIKRDNGWYKFDEEVELSGNQYKVFARTVMETPLLLDTETFVPYRPLEAIAVKKRIGICVIANGDHTFEQYIKDFPTVVLPTTVECYNIEDASQRKMIDTSPGY